MKTSFLPPLSLALILACGSASAQPAHHEHGEFEATLYAPFSGHPDARTFTLSFDYPGLRSARVVDWRLELTAPGGTVIRRWHGTRRLSGRLTVPVRWDGKGGTPGIYKVRMRAAVRGGTIPEDSVEQAWEIAVGR
ncbi:MAG TPA: phosphotransferase, partial [Telluria sp.]|nr:phosphotransferase [Telluria sp.]